MEYRDATNGADDGPTTQLPAWLEEVFDAFVELMRDHSQLMQLVRAGVARFVREPEAVKTMIAYEDYKAKYDPSYVRRETSEALDGAQSRAAFAEAQIDSGFTTLHLHGIMLIWASLETCVRDVVRASLLENPMVLARKTAPRLRVGAADLLTMSAVMQVDRVVSELEAHLGGTGAGGATRLEGLLEFVDLGGSLNDDLRRTLWELSTVRNHAAHHRGRVTTVLVAACPWVTEELGATMRLDEATYARLEHAAVEYVFAVLARACELYGGLPVPGFSASGRVPSTP